MKKILKNKYCFESDICSKRKKTSSCYCTYTKRNEERIGLIKTFIRICNWNNICRSCNIYAIMSMYEKQPVFSCSLSNTYVPTIFSCVQLNAYEAVDVNNIELICFNIIMNNILYVITPTNIYEKE